MDSSKSEDVLTKWCQKLISDEDLFQAEKVAKVIHNNNTVSSLILWANTLELNGKPFAAIEKLEQRYEMDTELNAEEKCKILTAKATILANNNINFPALKALMDAKKVSLRETDGLKQSQELGIEYKLASLHIQMGNFQAAQDIFEAKFDVNYGPHNDVTPSSTLQAALSDISQNSKVAFPEFEVVKPYKKQSLKGNVECVYFITGTLENCRNIGPALARQLDVLTGGRVHLHIHGVVISDDDPSNSIRGWNLLSRRLKKFSSVSLTCQNLKKLEFEPDHVSSVIALERFRKLPEIMQQYSCPIIVCDALQIPLYDPSLLVEKDFDVAVMTGEKFGVDIIAESNTSLSVFKTSENAVCFANDLKAISQSLLAQKTCFHKGLPEAVLAITKKKNSVAIIKDVSTKLLETNPKFHHPQKAYGTKAFFIAIGHDQDSQDFYNFLADNADDFSFAAVMRAMGVSGKAQSAIEIIDEYHKLNSELADEELFEIMQLKGLVQAHAGTVDLAHTSLEKALDSLPLDESSDRAREVTLYQLAGAKAALGYITEAQKIFDLAIDIDCGNGWSVKTDVIDLNAIDATPSNLEVTTLFENLQSDNSKHVYFVSADLEYCKIFTPALIAQFKKLDLQNTHLHIHGVSLEYSDTDDWQFLKEALESSDLSVTLTFKHVSLENLNQQQEKAVYASERFRVLPTLLKRYNTSIIVADIDQLPLRDPSPILDKTSDAQLLRFPEAVLNFFSVVSATLCVFHPTDEGMKLSYALKNYFDAAYQEPKKLNWHIDQAALAVMNYGYKDAEFKYFNHDIVEKNPRHVPLNHAKDSGAYFWSVTNSISGNAMTLLDLED